MERTIGHSKGSAMRASWAVVVAAALSVPSGCGGGGPDPLGLPPVDTMPPSVVPLPMNTPTEVDIGASEPTPLTIEANEAGEYAVIIEGTYADIDVTAYDEEGGTVLDTCSGADDGDVCFLELPAGAHYLELVQSEANFEIDAAITFVHIVDEGSADAPVDLDATTDPFHTVTTGGASFYVFHADPAGAYAATMEDFVSRAYGEVGWKMTWYAGADFTSVPFASCDEPMYCHAAEIDVGDVGLRVEHVSGDPVVLSFSIDKGLGEGTRAAPIALELGGPAHAGGVDHWSISDYTFTTGARPGGYILDFANLPDGVKVRVDVYLSPNDTTAVRGCDSAVTCPLTGLDPDTTYFAVVDAPFDATYDLSVAEGLSEGTEAAPVPLEIGVPHAGSVDAGSTSFYAFTPSVTGVYTLTTDAAGVVDTDYQVGRQDPGNTYFADRCEAMPCDFGPLLAGVTYYVRLYRPSVADTYTLTVSLDPSGEGAYADPYPLVVGEAHVGSVHPTYGSFYQFTADANGGRYGIALSSSAPLQVTDSPGSSYYIDCDDVTDARACTIDGLAPNQTVIFEVRHPSASPSDDLWLEVFDLRPAAPCAADAALCLDFESGTTPAELTEPAISSKPWVVATEAASTGTHGFEAGGGSPSCFELVTPSTSVAFVFSADVAVAVFGDQLVVRLDGVDTFFTETNVAYSRYLLGLVPGTSHTIQMCFEMGNGGTKHAFVDDLELH